MVLSFANINITKRSISEKKEKAEQKGKAEQCLSYKVIPSYGRDSFTPQGLFIEHKTQNNHSYWKELKSNENLNVCLVDFDRSLLLTDRYDSLFSLYWKQSNGDVKTVEKALHKACKKDLENNEIKLELNRHLITYLISFKKQNPKKNKIYVWTARDKTVHENFVRTILHNNNVAPLFDGLLFARGNAKRKCHVISALLEFNIKSIIVIDDKAENLIQAEKVMTEHKTTKPYNLYLSLDLKNSKYPFIPHLFLSSNPSSPISETSSSPSSEASTSCTNSNSEIYEDNMESEI